MKKVKDKKETKKERFVKIKAAIKFYKENRVPCKLIIYFVFIGIVVMMLRMNIDNQNNYNEQNILKNVDALEQLVVNENYDFTQVYNINNNLSTIIGNVNGDTQNFIYNDISYRMEDNSFISIIDNNEQIVESPVPYQFYNLTSSNIYKLIESATKVSTTDYETGEEVISYTIKSEKFYEVYNQITDELSIGEDINITTTELNNKITNIKIDLSSSANKLNPEYLIYTIDISY